MITYGAALMIYFLNIENNEVDPPGFEPGASALQGQRSPSLSYGPILRNASVL